MSDLGITFHGAARTVTGSRHLLGVGSKRILLDCGLFQGRRAESRRLNRELPFKAQDLDAVVLSHAHIDHSGNLPTLVKHGFRGPVFCTKATADLIRIMLADSAYIQEHDARFLNKRLKKGEEPVEPLYGQRDVEGLLELLRPQRYREDFEVLPGLSCRFLDAGHILGSAISCLNIERPGKADYRLVFTGDLGRRDLPILKDPEAVTGADALIMESTYGDRFHQEIVDVEEHLAAIVSRTAERGGKVIIPAFSVGRSQEIVYQLSELINAGEIPDLPIYIDSPLTVKASKIFADHDECFDEETREILTRGDDPFGFDRMNYITAVEDSKALNGHRGPCVIISASGMAEAGRILHHLRNNLGSTDNAVLIVGFMAAHTLGRRLEEGRSPVRILGREVDVHAEVHALHAFSAHADRRDLLDFVKTMDDAPRKIFLVHGEEGQIESLATALGEFSSAEIHAPEPGQHFSLD